MNIRQHIFLIESRVIKDTMQCNDITDEIMRVIATEVLPLAVEAWQQVLSRNTENQIEGPKEVQYGKD